MTPQQLEAQFRHLTEILYDTSVPAEKMEKEISPYLAEGVAFKDPWQTASGKDFYRLGMAGFHAMFRFKFEFYQVNVQVNPSGDGGRAIVDGVMKLQQLSWLYTYPLRTLLVYDFITTDTSTGFLITSHEEMWSFGDMIEGVPGVGRFYSAVFRPAFARGFLWASKWAVRRKSTRV